jgi:protein-S-isoprenylcysteine O-methyltransferase Ste14
VDNFDLGIYVVHGAFWTAFLLTRLALRSADREPAAGAKGAVAVATAAAPYSRALLILHTFAFFLLYYGIGNAVFRSHGPISTAPQRIAAMTIIVVGTACTVAALAHFRSWRFRAKLDEGHQLATNGPFRFVRHPIYLGLDLLALGSAVWLPTAYVWAAFVLMAVGGDLRARAEEQLLDRAFGSTYRAYQSRTKRFVPWVY